MNVVARMQTSGCTWRDVGTTDSALLPGYAMALIISVFVV